MHICVCSEQDVYASDNKFVFFLVYEILINKTRTFILNILRNICAIIFNAKCCLSWEKSHVSFSSLSPVEYILCRKRYGTRNKNKIEYLSETWSVALFIGTLIITNWNNVILSLGMRTNNSMKKILFEFLL